MKKNPEMFLVLHQNTSSVQCAKKNSKKGNFYSPYYLTTHFLIIDSPDYLTFVK